MSWLFELRSWLQRGRASSRNKRKTGRRSALTVEALEGRELLSTLHLDLGTATSPAASGYVEVPLVSYSATRGYGWQSTGGLSAADRGTGTALTRDMHLGTNGTFLADVTNGQYDVTVTLGDPATKRDNVAIWAEGQQAVANLTTAAGQVVQPTFRVNVVDGQLTLKFVDSGGANNTFAADGIDIVPAAATPAPTGLIAGYSFDAGTGATAADVTGTGHTGTISGPSWTSAGRFGSALSFDGTSSWVTVNNASDLNFTNGMTLEAWVKPTALNGWETVLLKERTAGLAYSLYAADDTGRPPAEYVNSNSDKAAVGSIALSLNSWTHLAGTYDGTNLRLYVNGMLTATRAVNGLITTSNGVLRIGGNAVWGEYFAGLIDEVRIYGRALSAREIQNDMNAPVGADTTSPTVTAVLPANAGSNVDPNCNITATLSEVMNASSINGTSFQLIAANGAAVPDTVSYDAVSRIATLHPTSALSLGTSYTAKIQGVTDLAGNAMVGSYTWSFTVQLSLVSANAGPDQTSAEGASVSFTGSATGGSGTYTSAWNFGDGGTASGTNPNHVFADNGTYTVTLTVTDSQGSSGQDTAVVTVSNVNPTATFSGGSAVNEGSPATISFSNPSDPSNADTAAGFKYSYDFNNDGIWDVVDVAQSSRTNTFNDNGIYTVRGRIKDKDGGFSDYTASVTVNNVAPTPNPGGPYTANTGTAIAFAGSASDPSSVDTAAGFAYSWNFGDGATSTAQNPSHAYSAAGTYTVTLTVTDKDGGASSASTTTSVTTQSSPSFPNNLNPPPLPAPTGVIIHVATVTQLQNAVANLQSGQTILIDPGTYNLTGTLFLPQGLTNVSIRGASGNVNDVVIKGAGMAGSITFGFWAGNVQGLTFGDFTLRDFSQHGIILNAGVQSPLIHNVHIIDIGDQFVKANPDGTGGGVNNGVVEYCTIEYSSLAPDTYTNGVDVHTGANWIIRNNVFRNIRAQGGLAGPAILTWNGSKNTVAEANTFIDCQREIAFGLDSSNPSDHFGGVVRNNFITRTIVTGDVAIGVWNSASTQVLNNSIILNGAYPNAIEYRFAATTGVVIKYNLTDAAIVSRDGATGTVQSNLSNAQSSWFVNAAVGDLHLTSAATAAIDQAASLSNVIADYDGQARGGTPDIGADEYQSTSASPVAANAGPDKTANEGSAVSFAGSATGGSGTYTYAWSFGDGGSGSGASPSHTFTDNGTYTVTLTVTDSLGTIGQDTAVVTVSNVAPTASLSGGNAVNEGSAATISFSNQSDPSSADTSAGFKYSYDFNNDGVWDLVDVTQSSRTNTFNDNGTYTVRGRIKDKDGGFNDYTATVTVNNVAPTAQAGGPYSGNPGAAISFTGNASDPSPVDTAAGFTYAWNFGDGATSTLQSPSHPYASAGTYTVTLTVKDKDGATGSANSTATVSTAGSRFSGPFVVTPYDKIPNFGANPTIYTIASGNWSNAGTWSAGRAPIAGDVVSIDPGYTVTYDVSMASTDAVKTVEVQANGKLAFRTDVSTTLYVSNLLVLQNGELDVGTEANPVAAGVTASIIFANKPLDTTADPAQYGNGLVGLGKVSMIGAAKPETFIRLAAEPKVGQTTLNLSDPATGWRVGDRLVLPDTRQLRDVERASNYVSQLEQLTIAAIAADGKTITLSAALKYNHPGARDINGVLDYLPHLADLTRSIVVRSESASGNRGQVMFTYRADVDIQYVQFAGLGRTKNNAFDDTTFDANGNLTHVGTNQSDRNPVQFRHLFGPTTAQADGYQYTFVGNSIFCPLNPMPFIWGININDSHYGLIKDNVLFNWAGAALVAETGSETGNVIDHNFSAFTTGSGTRGHYVDDAGDAFWFRGVNNYVRNNVATDVNAGGGDVYSYGFNYFSVYLGTISIPAFQGADMSVAGQTKSQDMNAIPLLEFSGNEVYGATQDGLTLWWIGTFGDGAPKGNAGTVKNFTVWHHFGWGYFGYETNNLVIDGFTARGDTSILSNPYEGVRGMWFADYMTRGLVVKNADIQGMATGIMTPVNMGHGLSGSTMTIQDSYLANTTNIYITPARSVNGSGGLAAMTFTIRNIVFATPGTVPASSGVDISMDPLTGDALGSSNFSVPITVNVYDYDGTVGDNFAAFFFAGAGRTTRARISGFVQAI